MFLIFLSIFLIGCTKNEPVHYDYVDLNQLQHIVYFRNCNVARLFKGAYIKYYKDGQILDSGNAWPDTISNKIFNNMLNAGANLGIKFTRLIDLNCVDCYIEQLFFNYDKKQAVISATARFGKHARAFYIVYMIQDEPTDNAIAQAMDKILEKLAQQIAEFIAKNL